MKLTLKDAIVIRQTLQAESARLDLKIWEAEVDGKDYPPRWDRRLGHVNVLLADLGTLIKHLKKYGG